MAKLAACEAARFAARAALQCHGAIGYTWEQDLHLFMRRAWSLDQAWGRAPFHLARVRAAILDGSLPIGPGATFQQEARSHGRGLHHRRGAHARSASAAAGSRASTPPISARTCSRALIAAHRHRPGRGRGRDLRLRATRSARRPATSRAPAGSRPACRSTCPASRSTASAARRSRRCTSRRRRVMSGTARPVVAGGVQNMSQIPISSAMTCARAARLHRSVLGLDGLGRALRHAGGVAVPRRRDDRREVGHHARGHGALRAREPPPRAARDRREALRARDRAATATSRATRARAATPRSRRWRR